MKRDKEKTNSANVNYFNSTNDKIVINKYAENNKNSLMDSSLSKSILNSNYSISHKHSNGGFDFKVENDKNQKNRNKKLSTDMINIVEKANSVRRDSPLMGSNNHIKIKKFKKLQIDPKTIKKMFSKTPSLISNIILLKNNNEKFFKLEDTITLTVLKNDYKSKVKKVFSVINFDVLIIKVCLIYTLIKD